MTLYTVLVIGVVMGIVSADVSELGYHYKVPHTSYGVPSYPISGINSGYNTGYTNGNEAGKNYKGQNSLHGYQRYVGEHPTGYRNEFESSASLGYQSGSGYTSSSGLNKLYQTGDSILKYYGNSFVQPSYQFSGNTAQGGYQALNQYQSPNQYHSSAVKKYEEYYNQMQPQPVQIYKHFYVHAAPEDNELPKPRQSITLPPPQKHYKIIFIKTPTPAPVPPQIIPVQQQNEEKTIVYVLVEKPEEAQNIVLPKIEQKPPSKPEVFFIKYNTKEGSQSVIDNIVNDYSKAQESVSYSGTSVSGGSNIVGSSVSDASNVFSEQSPVNFSGSQSLSQIVGSQTDNQVISDSIGSQSFETSGSGGDQILNQVVSNVDDETVSSRYDGSASISGVSSTSTVSSASDVSFENTVSTSQGVPHETYGPPKFRVI